MTDILVVRRPVVTEKSMQQVKNGRYTFMVRPLATKAQVAEAIETTFDVKVERVHMVRLAGKKKRTGKSRIIRLGQKKKKAVVTLAKGQKIALFEIEAN